MSNARDAAFRALADGILDASGTARAGEIETLADAVLAALGIPADATADDVKAAWLMWANAAWVVEPCGRPSRARWMAWDRSVARFVPSQDTRAAAVLALAAKLKEQTDA